MHSTEQFIPPTQVFDGFCYRSYNEDTDGWIEDQPSSKEFPSIDMARDIVAMFEEISRLRREVWRLKKIEEKHDDILKAYSQR